MRERDRPQICVVMTLYNKAAYVEAALRSIAEQTCPPCEVVVIDDGSTDDGPLRVQAFGLPGLRLIRQTNAGVASARNRGIRESAGEYIVFFDADDILCPDFIQTLSSLIKDFPGAGMYATGFDRSPMPEQRVAELVGQAVGEARVESRFFYRWAKGPFVCTGSLCLSRRALRAQALWFPEGEHLGEDQDLWFRIAERHAVVLSDSVQMVYRSDVSGSLTQKTRLQTPLPCYLRLAARLGGPGFPEDQREAARLLVECHLLNIARNLAAAGRRSDAIALLGRVRWWSSPLQWLRAAIDLLRPVGA